MSRRFALLLEYDGTRFAGSQLQPNARSVQGVLEEAIERVTIERSRVSMAGRTDAGVHAYGQVASFVSGTRLEPAVLKRALNACLPEDVVVRALRAVAESFDPRRQALRRHYRYLIDSRDERPALERQRMWSVPGPLDVQAMSVAARSIQGRHNFAAFAGALENPGASTLRDLQRFDVNSSGRTIVCDATANAFLPHQVRRMVGALVEVGRGRLSPEQYAALLSGPPGSAGPAAPAHGLYLLCVDYEPPLFEDDTPPIVG